MPTTKQPYSILQLGAMTGNVAVGLISQRSSRRLLTQGPASFWVGNPKVGIDGMQYL
jgi:hypothetical protein